MKRLFDYLMDLIFPVECLGCRREGDWLCRDCIGRVEVIDEFFCPSCLQKTPVGSPHKGCPSDIDGLFVCCWEKGVVKEIVYGLKYDNLTELASVSTDFMVKKIENSPLLLSVLMRDNFIFLPVPLHKKREWERGYNQSYLLADKIADYVGGHVEKIAVVRKVYTKSQTKLTKEKRIENIKDAFEVIVPELLEGKDIIIVDDVITTGATLKSLSFTIRKAVPSVRIYGLVFARATQPHFLRQILL